MFWDESGQSWSEMGIAGQPAVALYSASGTLIEKWYGGIGQALDILQTAAA